MCHHHVALYQNTSNYGPWVEISPMLWGLGFHIEIKKEIFKNLLVPNCKGKSFHSWYVASSSGPLPSNFIWCPWGQNWPRPWGHKLEHKTKEDQLKDSCSLKLEGLELWYLVFSISLWTLSVLFIWFPWSQNWPQPGDHKLGHRNKDSKFFSETGRDRPFIFGM